jgi:hypothetical protein
VGSKSQINSTPSALMHSTMDRMRNTVAMMPVPASRVTASDGDHHEAYVRLAHTYLKADPGRPRRTYSYNFASAHALRRPISPPVRPLRGGAHVSASTSRSLS